jgi:uroporphyrinogen-III synthase
VRCAAQADWVVFSSVNAVVHFASAVTSLPNDAKIAVVGPVTGDALVSIGLKAELIASPHSAEGLIASLINTSNDIDGKRVLFPCANRALKTIPEGLRSMGAVVDEVITYETEAEAPGEIAPEMVDVIAFASPTAVSYFESVAGAEATQRYRASSLAVCIGPSTTRIAEEQKYRNVLTADVHSIEGLVNTIITHYQRMS